MNAPHTPTDETRRQVAFMCAAGLDQSGICFVLTAGGAKISANTLRRCYKAELRDGYSSITYRMARRLIEKADAGDLGAIQFYLERRGGWVRRDNVALANADDKPLALSFRWADAQPQERHDSDQPAETRDQDTDPLP